MENLAHPYLYIESTDSMIIIITCIYIYISEGLQIIHVYNIVKNHNFCNDMEQTFLT